MRAQIKLRIPGWCSGALVRVGSEELHPDAATYCVLKREWHSGDVIELYLPMALRLNQRPRGAVAVQRGPLMYSLAPEAEWRTLEGDELYANHEVIPCSPWNYALALNSQEPEVAFRVEEHPVARQPFDAAHPPIALYTRARRVPDWELVDNSAGPLPVSPVVSQEPLEEVALIPYGAAKLRITEFPWTQG